MGPVHHKTLPPQNLLTGTFIILTRLPLGAIEKTNGSILKQNAAQSKLPDLQRSTNVSIICLHIFMFMNVILVYN